MDPYLKSAAWESYSIGKLADAAGVPTSTIRYYERSGLLQPDFRTRANYRAYSAASLERLRFIRSAQATGLSLQDITALLQLAFESETPCEQVLSLLRARLGDIRRRIKDLRHVERLLAGSLEKCCKGDEPDLCNHIIRLTGAGAASSKASAKKSRPRA